MSPALATITTLLIVTLCYIAACAYMPFGKCWRCNGDGARKGILTRLTRACRPCNGTGRRVRIGRRLHTWIKHEYHNSNR